MNSLLFAVLVFLMSAPDGSQHMATRLAPLGDATCESVAADMVAAGITQMARDNPDWKLVDYGWGCGEINLEGHPPLGFFAPVLPEGHPPVDGASPSGVEPAKPHAPGRDEAREGWGGIIRPIV